MEVVIYIDAYHTGHFKVGTGTYCITLEYNGKTKQYIEGLKRTTRYRTEITACIVALSHITKDCKITLVTNSIHVVEAVRSEAMEAWLDTGRNARGKPAKNLDLWQQLSDMLEKYPVEFRYVEENQYTKYMKYRIDHMKIEFKEDVNNV